ncbi:MAG: oxidoreductase [Mucilaginibacter sp.]|nr:oxidoreductase [Mucilaginibacter sp.]
MDENINGKIVVITGASSGLGHAAAEYLADRGATVVLGARRFDSIKTLADKISENGGSAIAIRTDVSDFQQVKRLVGAAHDSYGRVDVMINNAGLMPLSPIDRYRIDDWNQMIDVNIKGVLYGIASALPFMIQQKSGHFINVSSVAGHKVVVGGAVYSGTKFAVRAISEGLRQEVKPHNIRTTVISPGAVNTELLNTIVENDVSERLQKFYSSAGLSADSFARAVAFAISQPEDVDINEILFRPTRQES